MPTARPMSVQEAPAASARHGHIQSEADLVVFTCCRFHTGDGFQPCQVASPPHEWSVRPWGWAGEFVRRKESRRRLETAQPLRRVARPDFASADAVAGFRAGRQLRR